MPLADAKTPHDKLFIVRPGKQIAEPSTQRLLQSCNLVIAIGDHAQCVGMSSDFFVEVVDHCHESRFEKLLQRLQSFGVSIGPADLGTEILIQLEERRLIHFLLWLCHGWLFISTRINDHRSQDG